VVTEKTQRTMWIKWVRSGIGFTHRQKEMVRSLGLRRLNQEVERPDTPQIRGLVARIPHLVAIVDKATQPTAWASLPEYTIRPPEVAPVELPVPPEAVPVPGEASAVVPAEVEELVGEPAPIEPPVKATKEAPAPAKKTKAKKPAKPAAAEKVKAAAAKKGKPAPGKSAKPSKAGKK
jgi:large subunit ribosomal protein L30